MKKIEFKTTEMYLYTGAYDISEENKLVSIYTDEKIEFNIKDLIQPFQRIEHKFTLSQLKYICKESNIKTTIYPNGNISFSKLDSVDEILKTCYLSIVSSSQKEYVFCVAFDEFQPMLYKAQMISVFEFEKFKYLT